MAFDVGVKKLAICLTLCLRECLTLVAIADQPQSHIEILPDGAKKIVRTEEVSLVERNSHSTFAQRSGDPMELNPGIVGNKETTTEIIESGGGPTTTAIYMSGSAPDAVAPNALNTPKPLYEPGPPGPAGPPGQPGPPGDPGPPEGEQASTNSSVGSKMKFGSSGNSSKPLDANTQSGYEIRGPPGPPGKDGAPGDKGPVGTEGLEGGLGEKGQEGPSGMNGPPGPPGQRRMANAPPSEYLYYGLAVNVVFAIMVFAWGYVEFILGKSPGQYFSKCECCKRSKKMDDSEAYGGWQGEGEGEWASPGYGEESYGDPDAPQPQ